MGAGWRNTAERRKRVLFASAAAIVLALAAGRGLGLERAGDALMAAAALVAGAEIAARAWRALRLRHIGIELLVTVAAAGALVIGDHWEAAAVTFLFVLGGYLEARTLSRTRQAVQRLLESAPATAIVLRDGVQEEVPAHAVEVGDVVLVKPGSKVPVDGVVLDGYAAVDESSITGEPLPVEKQRGAPVYAGTISEGGLLRVRATGVGEDTTLARVIRRVEEAQESKAPAQRFVERFARWYTPLIIGMSILAGFAARDAHLALTLLVIGCPGALVISIPVSIIAGIGRAAREGILIKGGEPVERLRRVTAVAFDKTGTITEGKPRLTEVVAFAGAGAAARPAGGAGATGRTPEHAVLRAAAIAESGSEHPLARPVIAAAAVHGPVPQPEAFQAVPGRGIRAMHAGTRIDVGSLAALREWGIEVDAAAERAVQRIASRGGTPLLVAIDGVLAGLIGVADTPRPSARAAVERLHATGVRTIMLTGDGLAAARAIARRVGLDEVHAGLLPEEKLDHIQRRQESGDVVAMVGDGVNDAPALARADVGIALGAAASDVALETADVALMTGDLRKVGRALDLARRTMANVRQNVAIAVITVVALLAGVLAGNVDMAGGMLIHQASVLAVIGNALRLLRA
jgi:Cd2+/Zn2+-exporting ATPase